MKYKILNRTNQDTPPFRNELLELLKVKGEQLILGYGYLDENVVDKTFIDSIIDGFSGILKNEIIIIGKHASNKTCNLNSYIETCKKMQDRMPYANIKLLIAKKENYHKKVAIKSSKSCYGDIIPSMCIIGSSNLTKPTFADKYPNFNQELDIVFWRNNIYEKINCEEALEDESENLQLKFGVDVEVYKYLQEIKEDIDNLSDFIQCYPIKDKDMPFEELKNCYNGAKNSYEIEYSNAIKNKDTEVAKKCKDRIDYFNNNYDNFLKLICISTVEGFKNYLSHSFITDDYLFITLMKNYCNNKTVKDCLIEILNAHKKEMISKKLNTSKPIKPPPRPLKKD